MRVPALVVIGLLSFGGVAQAQPPSPTSTSWRARAERMWRRMHPSSLGELSRARAQAWERREWRGFAESVSEQCTLGNPTRDACRLAERTAGHLKPRAIFARSE